MERKSLICYLMLMFILKHIDCKMDIKYEGRKYVSEGSPIFISCLKTAYGVPKWSKNGVNINPLESDFSVIEETLPDSFVHMELRTNNASWQHRGIYKCDPQSVSSYPIEIVISKETDEVMRKQSKVQLRVNRTLKMVCDLEEQASFPINWYKDGSRVLVEDDRIRMEGGVLWIDRATKEDAGEYLCIIESSGGSYPIADYLGGRTKVTYPAEVKYFPKQIRPIFLRNFSLECEVRGFPVPRISWFVDNNPADDFAMEDDRYEVRENNDGLPNSVFFIKDVQYGDNHKITCSAENMEGSAATSTMLAVRANKLSTNEEEPGEGILITVGKDLTLQCNNTDDLSAKVEWFKNGAVLNRTDSRIHIEGNALIISNAIENDCGNYTCSSGGSEVIIAVKAKVILKPMDASRNVDQNRNIVLLCNVTQGTPLPTIKWLKGSDPLNMSDPRVTVKSDVRGIEGTEVVISDARFDDRAEYTCTASNEVNSVNSTILIRVKDKYAALWPFLGICAEVAILCTIIFIYEKRRQKPDFDESETDHNTENKSIPDQEDKGRDVRQRK